MNKLRITLQGLPYSAENNERPIAVKIYDLETVVKSNFERLCDEYGLGWDIVKIEQSTGVYDKHGTMIFDGDRVRISRYDGELQEEDVIQWKDGAWFIEKGVFCGSQLLGSYKGECLEVVG